MTQWLRHDPTGTKPTPSWRAVNAHALAGNMSSTPAIDPELDAVAKALVALDPQGLRIGNVLRDTLDQLYDGQRTGRYRWDQLHKTEKTHCGTLVEINLHREFEFADGITLDYQIAGIEVDCKYSQSIGGWMIPREAMGHLCILVWSDDITSKWSIGLVRIKDELLNPGKNLDSKRTLNQAGRARIHWLHNKADLSPNILLQLPRKTVDSIFALKSGQKRVNSLFRTAIGMRVGRGVVATLAQQSDYMKRVRGNGGARTTLGKEGIIILGQYELHRKIATDLGVAVPGRGESVSVRVAKATAPGNGVAEIDGELWRVATQNDPVVKAPKVRYY